MKKFSIMGCVVSLFLGYVGITWATNPCSDIVAACKQQGYYQGGNNVGKGIRANCVRPVIANRLTLPNTSFSPDVLQACQTYLANKKKAAAAAASTAAPTTSGTTGTATTPAASANPTTTPTAPSTQPATPPASPAAAQ